MTALSAASNSVDKVAKVGAALVPSHRVLPVAASQLLYYGAMVLEQYDTGYAIEPTGTAQGHYKVAGVARGGCAKGERTPNTTDADNSTGSAGDINVLVEAGILTLQNDATSPLTDGDAGLPCYAMDDATVSADSDCGNRPIAGIFLGLDDDDLPMVAVGQETTSQIRIASFRANADLSALQHTAVKLVDNVGKAEVASATSAAEPPFGVLLNTPAAGEPARVITDGPAPCLVGAAGITAGAQVTPAAGGAVVDGATTNDALGFALETGASTETKMIWVKPGYVV